MGAAGGNLLEFEVKWEETDLNRVDFEVISVAGREAISEHYEFKLNLQSKTSIEKTNLLGRNAKFTVQVRNLATGGTQRSSYHGIISEFSLSGRISDHYNYTVTLVPKLAKLKHSKNSDVFINNNLPTLLNEIFKNTHLFTEKEYEIAFDIQNPNYQPSHGIYNRYSYICQYEESDYNFINRILERDGVYYYFEQDEDQERLVITDTKDKYIQKTEKIKLRSQSDQTTELDPSAISYIELQSKLAPKKVTITNFGYEKAHLGDKGAITCSAFVSADGLEDTSLFGEEVIYGENFINPEQNADGSFLANIRAQEMYCQSRIYKATSTITPIYAGMKITIEDEKTPEFNGDYLVVEVEHSGYQQLDGAYRANESRPFYENKLVLIQAQVQFRPLRKTVWPKITGTMNALIDGDGQSQYPQLDSKGRYKVWLPFLRRYKEKGKASIWLRLATPYAGNGFGMHFPLHKDTEVVLSFRDGNPDMPLIMGAVFNSLHQNVVINHNAYLGGVLMTQAGNTLAMDDTKGAYAIGIATNNHWQYLQ